MRALRLITLAAFAGLAARADSLDAVLTRMDAASKEFKSAIANITKTEHNALLNDTTEESGVLKIKREKNSIAAITEYTKPEPHAELLRNKEARVYQPKANTVQIYNLSKFKSTVDQFALLAFGSSSADLKKNYDVKLGGTESINGTPATRIELVPKSDEVRKTFPKFELWIPANKGNAIRERVTGSSGDTYIIDYADVKINPNIPDSEFALKTAKGAKEIQAR